MAIQSLIDEGYELWYIVLDNSNQRYRNFVEEPFIFDDIEVANDMASRITEHGNGRYVSMMVKDYNQKYAKHNDIGGIRR